MKAKTWHGPKGTAVFISEGSSQPPVWALHLIDRVASRAWRTSVGLRWTKGDGGGYYYPGLQVLSIKAGGWGKAHERAVLVHELAHWLDPSPRGRAHRDSFYATMMLIGKREGEYKQACAEAGPTKARRARKLIAQGGVPIWQRLGD